MGDVVGEFVPNEVQPVWPCFATSCIKICQRPLFGIDQGSLRVISFWRGHSSLAFLWPCPEQTDASVGQAFIPIDDADLYLEQVNCDDECRYYRPDGWRRCEKIEENFTVSGGARQPITLLRTDTGPIVSNVEKGRAMALRWTGLAGTGLFQCMYHVNRAADSSDLRKAASSQIAPLFEIVWADSAGNIGSQIAGKIPVRPSSSENLEFYYG